MFDPDEPITLPSEDNNDVATIPEIPIIISEPSDLDYIYE